MISLRRRPEISCKIAGKVFRSAPIFLNRDVICNLTWLRDVIPHVTGVRFVDDGLWSLEDADLIMWSDAALTKALAFVFSNQAFVYPIQPPPTHAKIDIFFLELLAILSGIHYVASLPHPPRRVLVWTDSLNSVDALNSLSVSHSLHNAPSKVIASILMATGIDIHVRHIQGKKNIRADLLSRLLLDDYAAQFPADSIRLFSPPRDLLPERCRLLF